jgi:FkbM family methyltransferase
MLWQLARRVFLRLARVVSPYAATSKDDVDYVVSTRDAGPGGSLFVLGTTPEFEVLPNALAILHDHGTLPERGLFIDVGANIGTTALPAVKRYGFTGAIAVEPDDGNVRLLRANIELNGLGDRIEVIPAAAGEAPGTARFRRGKATRSGWRAGAGSVAVDANDAAAGPVVPLVTVDVELAARQVDPDDVGLLWIDVQGHEAHVLAGARSLLDASCPVVFALRPRKLEKHGGLEPLIDLVASRYDRVVDLRADDPAPVPAPELPELIAATSNSDILAFNTSRAA